MSTSQAEHTRVHPRRRPLKTAPPSLSSSTSLESYVADSSSSSPSLSLRKGETFHSPSPPPSDDLDPVLNFRSLPQRSPTCPRSLEAIAAREQRMVDYLSNLNLNSLEPSSPLSDKNNGDDLPVPRAILQAHIDSQSMADRVSRPAQSSQLDAPSKVYKSHCHASDSGLGASLSSENMSASDKSKVKAGQLSYESQSSAKAATRMTQSAITSSISAFDAKQSQKRQLGLPACKQIERLVIKPILKEERLKPFHPLVQSIPQRIVDREIGCLRDLEKTLLWLAPNYAASRASYLRFCEFTIQCLHTSVYHLNERDQRLPADRPYTNGYFLDLVAQIRRYAAMINESRNSMPSDREPAQGSAKASAPKYVLSPPSGWLARFNIVSSERVTLEGGLSKNGRPAELVVHKDGEMISLRTGRPYEENAVPAMKRSLSLRSVDEGVERSMARRKKNAPPMDINQKCKDCDKVFKRPCDLTKHEKTHSRPWKCIEPSCKYHEIGWPTEKERDRHINDKHSRAPALYKCKFAPCTYSSKRESNCKQHMEKAHGWDYVRSKHNGRSSKKAPNGTTPQTPSISTPSSKAQDIATPLTGSAPSPFEPVTVYPQNPPFSFADPPTQTGSGDFPLFTTNSPFEDLAAGVNGFSPLPTTSLDFQAFQSQLEGADPNGLIPLTFDRQSFDSASPVPDLINGTMGFDTSPVASTDSSSLNFDLAWSQLDAQNVEEEFTTLTMQMLTPEHSVPMSALNSFSRDPSISNPSPLPVLKRENPLYTPDSCHVDEGVSDLFDPSYQSKADFMLFDHNANFGAGSVEMSGTCHLSTLHNANQMFPSLNTEDLNYMTQGWPQDMEMEHF
ncbi:C2H2 type zinc finger domain protein [Aspergillus udagawae]|uniref:C2H2 type zinc finger domain protein n=1 Tax=Aspergillus udagawae TaxID=91492 RepID=A0A8H3RN72_9EURO|nr:copper-binding transcription factor [Aspergillus udagawae]GFF31733.1 C2H2 type zinc finger domain protein [Aspergillus udagawae]GIC86736.1 copper-binding transcription factor [Aspergillus udagawae]